MRLIDADSIKYHRTTECGGHGVFLDVDMVYKEEIDAIPTIDAMPVVNVRPVVHARWVEYKRAHYFKCSSCKKPVPYRKAVQINGTREYNFCPNCGAKMEGGHNP